MATDSWLGGPTPGAPPTPRSLAALGEVAREQRGLITRLGPTAPGVDRTEPGRDDWRTRALAALLALRWPWLTTVEDTILDIAEPADVDAWKSVSALQVPEAVSDNYGRLRPGPNVMTSGTRSSGRSSSSTAG